MESGIKSTSMNTPIEKHPKYTLILEKLIRLISEEIGCKITVTYHENINVVYAQIESVVLDVYKLRREQLFTSTKNGISSHARYVIAYLMRTYTPMPDGEIARRLQRDRSTIIHGYNEIRLILEKGDERAEKITQSIEKLKELHNGNKI